MNQKATYEISCKICQVEKGRKTSYIGETARTPFERGADHLGDLKNWRMSNALVKHLAESHPGRGWDHFSMKVLNTHRSPMERQIKEGQLISSYKGDEILNQKGEWGQNLPPRLVVEDGRNGQEKPINPEATQTEKQRGQQRKQNESNEETQENTREDEPQPKRSKTGEEAKTAPPLPGTVIDRVKHR